MNSNTNVGSSSAFIGITLELCNDDIGKVYTFYIVPIEPGNSPFPHKLFISMSSYEIQYN